MAFDSQLAERVRIYLSTIKDMVVIEKKMFGGLAFMVNDKMCVNVGEQQLMCRFDPALYETLKTKKGFVPMYMNKKIYKGYCYVDPIGYKSKKDFEYWINLCLDYNHEAKSSKKSK